MYKPDKISFWTWLMTQHVFYVFYIFFPPIYSICRVGFTLRVPISTPAFLHLTYSEISIKRHVELGKKKHVTWQYRPGVTFFILQKICPIILEGIAWLYPFKPNGNLMSTFWRTKHIRFPGTNPFFLNVASNPPSNSQLSFPPLKVRKNTMKPSEMASLSNSS